MSKFKWQKLGHVFSPSMVSDTWWMKNFAQAPAALVLEDRVRVFFSTRPHPNEVGLFESYLAYLDLNPNNLLEVIEVAKKPVIELGDLGTFDEFGVNPATVIKHGDETRIYYAGWTRCDSKAPVNTAIGIATSYNDGIHFNRIGPGPVLSYSLNEPFILGSPRVRKIEDTWYLWYVAGCCWVDHDSAKAEPVYKIRMATSKDGIDWQPLGHNLIEDQLGENECQASPEVIFRDGKYHMFFSYRPNFDFKTKANGYRIGYASSDDLFTWKRQDELAGIDVSEQGWDSEMVSYPNIFELNGSTFMLYQGNEIGLTGFGLAKLQSA